MKRSATLLLGSILIIGAARADGPTHRDDLTYGQAIDAAGMPLDQMLSVWTKVLDEPVVLDPQIAKKTIRIFGGDAKLTWGVMKRALDFEDVVAYEVPAGDKWVLLVDARRNLAALCGPPHKVLLPGDPLPERDEIVTQVIPLPKGKGNEVFGALRMSLIHDTDRIGNLLLCVDPDVMMVDHRSPIADYYTRRIHELAGTKAPEKRARPGSKVASGLDNGATIELGGLATGIDVQSSIKSYGQKLGAEVQLDDSTKDVTVKLIAPSSEVSWGAFKAALEAQSVVVEERESQGRWTLIPHSRRSLPSAVLAARPVTEDAPFRDANEFVEVRIVLAHRANDIFATLRGLLVRDVNRVAKIDLDAATKTLVITDFAKNAAYYAEIARALDDPPEPVLAEKKTPAPVEPGTLGAKIALTDGALEVSAIEEGSGAAKASLAVGDKVKALSLVRGIPLEGKGLPWVRTFGKLDDLRDALQGTRAGDTVVLQIERGKESGALPIVLGAPREK